MSRALVLRALGLGDLLAGVPALRVLRRARPDHEVVLAAPGVLAPLVDLVDAVDRLLPTGELQPVPWTGPPPELGVDLHGNGPASRVLVEALDPGQLVAFDGGPHWDPDEHERARWCRLLHEGLGVEPRDGDADDLLIAVPDAPVPVEGATVVHPGAASGSRRWAPERYAAVARHLAAAGHEVVITGSAAESPLAGRVAEAAGLPPSSVLAGRTDLAALAALVAHARLVVCGDTGLAHVASAYRTPSVVLFGPTPPSTWGPPGDGPHTVLWHGRAGERGDPHGRACDPALARVQVREVVEAADALEAATPPPAPAAARD
ncbi:MAG: glycosyltransferase family 9 protein [Nocardioides sp.]|nr:glycosyltransferase family 9 protein [Nocardioides sp.]